MKCKIKIHTWNTYKMARLENFYSILSTEKRNGSFYLAGKTSATPSYVDPSILWSFNKGENWTDEFYTSHYTYYRLMFKGWV